MRLARCGLAGEGGTALPAHPSLPAPRCQPASGRAVGWRSVAQPAGTCRRVPGRSGSCAGSANALAPGRWRWLWFPPFPLPFCWQKPMVGVSCALLTAVEFLPLASLSGAEIQGGSDLPEAASCKCSYLEHGEQFHLQVLPGGAGQQVLSCVQV